MFTSRIFITIGFFGLLFFLQEIVFNQIHFLIGGFSIFLAVTMTWIAMESRNGALISGFIAGFFLDLSPNIDSPFGQWTLIMLLAGYAISYIGYGDDNVHANAIGIVFFVVVATFFVEVAFLISGALLGVSVGSIAQVVITLIGMSMWSLLVAPIMLPLFTKLHALVFDSRSVI